MDTPSPRAQVSSMSLIRPLGVTEFRREKITASCLLCHL